MLDEEGWFHSDFLKMVRKRSMGSLKPAAWGWSDIFISKFPFYSIYSTLRNILFLGNNGFWTRVFSNLYNFFGSKFGEFLFMFS